MPKMIGDCKQESEETKKAIESKRVEKTDGTKIKRNN